MAQSSLDAVPTMPAVDDAMPMAQPVPDALPPSPTVQDAMPPVQAVQRAMPIVQAVQDAMPPSQAVQDGSGTHISPCNGTEIIIGVVEGFFPGDGVHVVAECVGGARTRMYPSTIYI